MALEKNLSALRQHQPEAARRIEGLVRSPKASLSQTKKGLPVHRFEGKLLHSLWNPHTEAERWVQKCERPPEVAFGFGDGYHLEAFLEKEEGLGGNNLIVIEPAGELLRAVFEDRDLTHILKRIRLIADASPAEAVEQLRGGGETWYFHPPSRLLHQRYIEALQGLTAYQAHDGQRLRILVVGPVYGGSYPIACYVTETLKELNHDVDFVDFTSFYSGYQEVRSWEQGDQMLSALEQLLSWLVEQRTKTFSPDLILFLAQAPVREESLQRIRNEGVKVAYWFVEDFRIMSYWNRLAPHTDAFFTIQRDGQDTMRDAGVPYVRYLPLAASPAIHRPCDLTTEEMQFFGSPLSFVGAGYPNRRRFFERFASLDLKIWGNEWDGASPVLENIIQEGGRRVSSEETVKIFNASQVNFNLHSSPYHKDVDPYGDFVNPRTFELAGCNAFQLVDRRTLFKEVFAEDEIMVFEDIKDAREKTVYALENESDRLLYAARGRIRVLKEHTYRLRMKELLGSLFRLGLQGRSVLRTAEELIQEAQLPELREYLSHFPGQATLSLEEIAASIHQKSRKSELTKEDRLWQTLIAFKEEAECKRSSL